VLQFLSLGFMDYVGARSLLRSRLPLQGAVLASTAVEKYFKAIALVGGKSLRGHLKEAHVQHIRAFVPELFAKFNPKFLTFLERCYVLRYTDSLPPGFTLKVYARETLAELDEAIINCESQVTLRRSTGQAVRRPFDTALERRDEVLVQDNHVLNGIPKTEFLRHRDYAYAILNRPSEGLLEADFVAESSPQDGEFTRPGIWRVPNSE
jgi:hypothetical protein